MTDTSPASEHARLSLVLTRLERIFEMALRGDWGHCGHIPMLMSMRNTETILDLSTGQVRRLVAAGDLVAVCLPDRAESNKGAWMVRLSDLMHYITANPASSNAVIQANEERREIIERANSTWGALGSESVGPEPKGSETIGLDSSLSELESVVYVAFDSDGVVLYVGVTDELRGRLASHRATSAWWIKARAIRYERFAGRRLALLRETELIRLINPPFNILGKRPTAAAVTS